MKQEMEEQAGMFMQLLDRKNSEISKVNCQITIFSLKKKSSDNRLN